MQLAHAIADPLVDGALPELPALRPLQGSMERKRTLTTVS
jgi:hypothetical protein